MTAAEKRCTAGGASADSLIPSAPAASPGKVNAAVAAALRLSLAQGAVISLSAGEGEQCFTPAETAQVNPVLQAAQRDHATVVVSSGDYGAAITPCHGARAAAAPAKGVDWPASDPLALAAGGTSLQASRATGPGTTSTPAGPASGRQGQHLPATQPGPVTGAASAAPSAPDTASSQPWAGTTTETSPLTPAF